MVHDMGSTNTTLVNGEQIQDHFLRVGDVFQTGDSQFRFEHTLAGDPWPIGARALLEEILSCPEDDEPP
jgi:pSer/pThr/pTyr-binding forkhead associated (FHA) protein